MKKLDAGRSLLLVLLTAVATAAFPEPQSREEALKALASTDAATRAEAVVWIANRGAMADDSLLHQRLRDESGLVRSYAEQGLWLLWTRSGDAAIDRQMAQATELLGAGRFLMISVRIATACSSWPAPSSSVACAICRSMAASPERVHSSHRPCSA